MDRESPAPPPDPAVTAKPAGDLTRLLGEWRESLQGIHQAIGASLEEVASVRQELATGVRELEARPGEPGAEQPPPDGEALAALARRLEAAEVRMREHAADIQARQDRAVSSGSASLRRVAATLQQVQTASQRRESVSAAVVERLGAFQDAVSTDLAERLGAMQRRLLERVSALEEQEGRLLGSQVGALERITSALRDLRESQQELRKRDEESTKELKQRFQAVAEDVASLEERLVSTWTTRTRSVLSRVGDSWGQRMDAIEARLTEIADPVAEVGASVAEMGEVVDRTARDISPLRDEVLGLRQELAGHAESLRAGLARVDELAAIIESMGRRRGFRELVKTEQQLRETQAGFVDRLTASAEGLEATARAMEERVRSAAEAVARELAPQGAHREAIDRLRDSVDALARELPARVGSLVDESAEELRRSVASDDGARAQRDLGKTVTALRAEVETLRKRIEGWGKPRTAPRLAVEVNALDERVRALEATDAEGTSARKKSSTRKPAGKTGSRKKPSPRRKPAARS